MPCLRTCSACRRVSSQLSGEPCDSSPMPAGNGRRAEPARRAERSAPRQRREPSPAPRVTAAARQAVTQHFPPAGPAPDRCGRVEAPPGGGAAQAAAGLGTGSGACGGGFSETPGLAGAGRGGPSGEARPGETARPSLPRYFSGARPNMGRRRPCPAEMATGKCPPAPLVRPSPRSAV